MKFFDKANMLSDNKFSLRTSTFEPRKIVSTVFNVMFDVLRRDEKASFFFIGAEDEKDTPGKATRRFQFYSDFTLSVVSNRIFRHFRNDHLSLYILINKEHVADVESLKNRITHYVAKTMAEE